MTKEQITILMPTRGRRELVAQRLAQIEHRPLLLVVDQGRREVDLPADLQGAEVVECEPGCGAPKAFEAGVMAARTPWLVMLCDDVECAPGMLEEAMRAAEIRDQRSEGKTAIVAFNDGLSHGQQACFSLFSKQFYLDQVYPVQYQKYYIDTELGEKAKWLGRYVYAPRAKCHHTFFDGQDLQVMAEDSELFMERMQAFRANTPRHAPHLMAAVPVYGAVQAITTQGLIDLASGAPVKTSFRFNVGNPEIALARAQIAMDFLSSDCTHLLMIDSDIGFNRGHVKQLLDRDLDIVGGMYPFKRFGPAEYVCNSLPDNPPALENGLQELKYIGTGFLMIKRRVLEVLRERHQGIRYISDYSKRLEYDFFAPGVFGKRRLSEDWAFCERARACGFQVWGDTRVKLLHYGAAVFPQEGKKSEVGSQKSE